MHLYQGLYKIHQIEGGIALDDLAVRIYGRALRRLIRPGPRVARYGAPLVRNLHRIHPGSRIAAYSAGRNRRCPRNLPLS